MLQNFWYAVEFSHSVGSKPTHLEAARQRLRSLSGRSGAGNCPRQPVCSSGGQSGSGLDSGQLSALPLPRLALRG